jgi:cyanophycinase-like exopeptidase
MKTNFTLISCLLFTLNTFAQSYISYTTGNTVDVVTNPQGGICLMGGASESDEAMIWFLERANGGDILVLRASGSDGYNNYMYSDLGVTVNSVETIVFNNASASTDAYIHQQIQQAEAIWFAGGDQWDYVSYWRNTEIQDLLNDALANRNIVIGGTSAGMAIQGNYYFSAENGTITSATALSNPYANTATVSNEPFLQNDYLTDVITDTHYDDPDRRGRHVSFLARIMTDHEIVGKGIACDEYTAVCIDEDGLARVYGGFPTYDDNAYFIQPNCELPDMTPENCTVNSPLNWNRGGAALKVYKVKGTIGGANSFNLADWETGTGGVWEHWSVNNGTFATTSGSQIACVLSVDEVQQETIQVFPNPVQNELTITAQKPLQSITLIDSFGRLIVQRKISGLRTLSLDVSQLQSGIYFLKIESNGVFQIKKIVK